MDGTWTIGELAERAAALLGAGPRPNGRVRDVPNARLIRWYATIGLLDPPLARRGRVALYGRRHLLQLVAIKRRQAEGLSIAEIQTELAGATDEMLERVSGLAGAPPAIDASAGPPGGVAPAQPGGAPDVRTPPPTDTGRQPGPDRFWTRSSPAPAPLHTAGSDPAWRDGVAAVAERTAAGDAAPVDAGTARDDMTAVTAGAPGSPSPVPASSRPFDTMDARWAADLTRASAADLEDGHARDALQPLPADLVYGVRLAPGVTVMLHQATRPPTERDLAALREAAAPLIADLVARGLAARPESAMEGS
ncbi:helix-turn-helix domain-containing protein [Microtetraspora fusca]|uniref:helix-turn-helix domain-containing protein n=1 Tax=Microtetraspora fusca TaxID=1997 RepID=UPI0009FF9441|nr:helix-turn-helix domain-containing protein [Microtetraspora fusca]